MSAKKNKYFTSEEQHERMTKTPVPRLILSMALPTVISQLITVIYNTADTFFVSQIGTSAAAAVGVVFSLMAIIQSFGFGIGVGANNIISRKLGEKKDSEAEKFASSAFFAAVVVGVVVMFAGLLMLDKLMLLLGSTETILPYSRAYAKYILMAAPVMCSSFILSNVLRSEGEAVLSMWGLCTGGILNIILDPIFIFTLNMGIAGAAVATALSQCVSFIILLSAFLRNKSIVKLNIHSVSRRATDYLLIIKTGMPSICRQGMASIASTFLNIQASLYGDAALAAITIGNKVYMILRNVIIGIGQGFQPVAGYNYGANKKKRVKEAFTFSCILGTAVCVVGSALLAYKAEFIISWFRNDPTVIEIGARALIFNCLVTPVMAYSTYVNQLYQSLGFSGQATFLSCCRQGIFFIPLIFVLPAIMGLTGVQMTQPAADLMTFLISIPFNIVFFKKYLKEKPPVKDVLDEL